MGQPDASSTGPIPVGAAVHTGAAFVGSTGAEGTVSDFTALGDVVNTTARLQRLRELMAQQKVDIYSMTRYHSPSMKR